MLEDKIYQDYVQAMKSKDKHRSTFLSFIRAELKNAAITLKKDKLSDNEVLGILKKQKKRLEEAKESIDPSVRLDLFEAAKKELAILEAYLPKPMEEAELVKVIEETIAEVGASSMKDMGRMMKAVLEKVGVRAEAKKVSDLVRAKLSSN